MVSVGADPSWRFSGGRGGAARFWINFMHGNHLLIRVLRTVESLHVF